MGSPAQHVIEKCGGFVAVSDMLGVSLSRVYRWTYAKEQGGTGGIIPSKHQSALLKKAREASIALHPHDFFQDEAAPDSRGAS